MNIKLLVRLICIGIIYGIIITILQKITGINVPSWLVGISTAFVICGYSCCFVIKGVSCSVREDNNA